MNWDRYNRGFKIGYKFNSDKRIDFSFYFMGATNTSTGKLIDLTTGGHEKFKVKSKFGGPKQKKFKLKTLENILIEISDKEIEVQKHELYRVFNNWKGENEQTDDVCVVGFKIT